MGGKSRKKPDSEVDSDPALVASPATPIENEKAVGSKKQKIDNGDEEHAFEKKNLGKEMEENTEKVQHNSLEDNKVEVPSEIKPIETTQDAKRASISNQCEEENGDDKDHQHLETLTNSVEVSQGLESTPTIRDAKRARISNEYEEDRNDNSNEDHQHLETPMDEVPPAIKSEETIQDAERASISDECEEEDGDDTFKDSDVEIFDASSPKETAQTPGSKTVLMDNLSFLIKEEDVKIFFKNVGEIAEIHFDVIEDYFTGHGRIEFTTADAAQEALKLNNTSLLDRPVKLDLATERGDHPTTTPHATGSKTLYLGNLSFSIEEDDVRDFFKDVGEIASIRFVIRDERFQGYGYIEFTTVEAAQEALKLNTKVILDRQIRLDLARERGAYIPSSSLDKYNRRGGHAENFNQRDGHAQGRTIYVRGFNCSDGFDNIRSTLEKHFGKCGEISRMSIPKDYESGAPKGVAFIDFTDSNGFRKGLGLHGSEVGGSRIIVEEAKTRRGDAREGSGYYGGGRGGSGGGHGRESGSSGGGWGSRGNDYGGGWSRSSGGWHREGSYGGGWRREGSYGGGWRGGVGFRGSLGRGSSYGGGGFSSSRVGRFSGGSRDRGGSRP